MEKFNVAQSHIFLEFSHPVHWNKKTLRAYTLIDTVKLNNSTVI